MALLRCNYYPKRSNRFAKKDFGIAPHTDYGCLTLLFTEGTPGLEVELPSKKWERVNVKKNEMIVNFAEMLEIWWKNKSRLHDIKSLGVAARDFQFPFTLIHNTIQSYQINQKF